MHSVRQHQKRKKGTENNNNNGKKSRAEEIFTNKTFNDPRALISLCITTYFHVHLSKIFIKTNTSHIHNKLFFSVCFNRVHDQRKIYTHTNYQRGKIEKKNKNWKIFGRVFIVKIDVVNVFQP